MGQSRTDSIKKQETEEVRKTKNREREGQTERARLRGEQKREGERKK